MDDTSGRRDELLDSCRVDNEDEDEDEDEDDKDEDDDEHTIPGDAIDDSGEKRRRAASWRVRAPHWPRLDQLDQQRDAVVPLSRCRLGYGIVALFLRLGDLLFALLLDIGAWVAPDEPLTTRPEFECLDEHVRQQRAQHVGRDELLRRPVVAAEVTEARTLDRALVGCVRVLAWRAAHRERRRRRLKDINAVVEERREHVPLRVPPVLRCWLLRLRVAPTKLGQCVPRVRRVHSAAVHAAGVHDERIDKEEMRPARVRSIHFPQLAWVV